MKIFDVQGVEIKASVSDVLDYVANPQNLPKWTNAFKSISGGKAVLATPGGSTEIQLEVRTSQEWGTIDWIMTFPDGSIGTAYSRVVDSGKGSSIYSFVLLAPPVPLAQLEGALQQQIVTLREELSKLKKVLESKT